MDDKLIANKILKGDATAFKELVDSYQVKVVNTCYGFLHNYEDAQDLAQEVFIEIHRSIKKFRNESKLSTWIYRISVNKSLNFIRDNKKRKWFQSLDILFDSDFRTNNQNVDYKSPQKILESNEKSEIINKAINSLPEKQKTAFVLHRFEDLSYKEISEVMKTSLSSVESILFRAKKNLQKKLVNIYKKK